jgi:hypothetical protein
MKKLSLLLILISSQAYAFDEDNCTSYTTASKTTVEDCRDKKGNTRHCESYASASGEVHKSCR